MDLCHIARNSFGAVRGNGIIEHETGATATG